MFEKEIPTGMKVEKGYSCSQWLSGLNEPEDMNGRSASAWWASGQTQYGSHLSPKGTGQCAFLWYHKLGEQLRCFLLDESQFSSCRVYTILRQSAWYCLPQHFWPELLSFPNAALNICLVPDPQWVSQTTVICPSPGDQWDLAGTAGNASARQHPERQKRCSGRDRQTMKLPLGDWMHVPGVRDATRWPWEIA